MYFASSPSSWHRTPKTLVTSWLKGTLGASFVLMRWLWVDSCMAPEWWVAGHQKDQAIIKSLEFTASPSPSFLQREERGWKWELLTVPMWGSLYKIPIAVGLGDPWVGEHMEVWGEWHTHGEHGSAQLFTHTLPYASLPWGCSSISFIIPYNKLANVT